MGFNPNEHLMDLKGKKYLQVMWRLVWFREEKPLWSIDTKLEQLTDNHAVFCAKIYDENGVQKSAGYGSEGVKDFRDFIEKAETKAVGRALAMLGYGTQFAPELDEEERIVDSPVPMKKSPPPQKPAENKDAEAVQCEVCREVLKPYTTADGVEISVHRHAKGSVKKYGRIMCLACIEHLEDTRKRLKEVTADENAE